MWAHILGLEERKVFKRGVSLGMNKISRSMHRISKQIDLGAV
jgi:hypothetical protein